MIRVLFLLLLDYRLVLIALVLMIMIVMISFGKVFFLYKVKASSYKGEISCALENS